MLPENDHFFLEVGPLAALLALRWPLGRILAPGLGAWRTLGHLWQTPNHKSYCQIALNSSIWAMNPCTCISRISDTISYALGPGDTKNDAKTTSRSTHIEFQKKGNHEFGHETALDGSI